MAVSFVGNSCNVGRSIGTAGTAVVLFLSSVHSILRSIHETVLAAKGLTCFPRLYGMLVWRNYVLHE